jgi:hypothetical protein
MTAITVSTVIARSPQIVWAEVRDITRHVQWMADAESITITSAMTQGVGTTFDCLTKVGPLSLVDKMEIVTWDEGWAMGVRHVGLVTGTGEFRLAHNGDGTTLFTWSERLMFPWWMGGPIGGLVGGKIVLHFIWRRNLRRLRALIERAMV